METGSLVDIESLPVKETDRQTPQEDSGTPARPESTAPPVPEHGNTDPAPFDAFRDGRNRPIELRRYDGPPTEDDFEALVRLFVSFDPAYRSSGIPPLTEPDIRTWLTIVLSSYAVVAWHGTRAVGLVVLLPDGDDKHELAIFVHQEYHQLGVGGRLVAAMLAKAIERRVRQVGLLTTGDNRAMLALALEFGFVVTDQYGGQVELTLDLATPKAA